MNNSSDLDDEVVKAWLNDGAPEKRKIEGYVYLLRFREFTKIGWTQDTAKRLKQFNDQLPDEVTFEHVISVDDVDTAERWLHSHFAEKRKKNEWFLLSGEDIQFTKGLSHDFYAHRSIQSE